MIKTAEADVILAGFASVLRQAGLAITPDRTTAYCEAVSLVGLDHQALTYWAGRATLCASPEDVEVYDKAFSAWFHRGNDQEVVRRPRPRPVTLSQASLAPAQSGAGKIEDQLLAARTSETETLRHRDIATLSEPERAQLAAMFAALDVRTPVRRALRRRPHHRGGIDARRTLRQQLRTGGEVTSLRYRRRRTRPRHIVMLIDVSGSMQPYADSLLRLAHRIVGAAPGSVEVFTLGTRLTRVTAAMRARRPDDALAQAGRLVPDWSGGTRLGEVMAAFVGRWGRRGLARQAVIVVASDGWERGNAALLGEQMRQLALLSHAVIWINPHRGKAGYAPIQSGIVASLPAIDHLVAGHSMAAFAELAGVLADA